MRKIITIFVVSLAALITYCATPPKIVDAQAQRGKAEWERMQVYNQNKIIEPDGIFSSFKVGETGYTGEGLGPLFTAPYTSSEAKNSYSAGNTWNIVAGALGAGGGFMLGYNIGLASRGADTSTGLWAAGALTTILAIAVGGIAEVYYTEAIHLYNNDLMKALDLQQKTAAVKPPEQFAHYMTSVSHAL